MKRWMNTSRKKRDASDKCRELSSDKATYNSKIISSTKGNGILLTTTSSSPKLEDTAHEANQIRVSKKILQLMLIIFGPGLPRILLVEVYPEWPFCKQKMLLYYQLPNLVALRGNQHSEDAPDGLLGEEKVKGSRDGPITG